MMGQKWCIIQPSGHEKTTMPKRGGCVSLVTYDRIGVKGGDSLQMIPVRSTNILSVGYENGVLVIAFRNGGSYSYQGVPEQTYQMFMAARSLGQFYTRYIKGRFPSVRIG